MVSFRLCPFRLKPEPVGFKLIPVIGQRFPVTPAAPATPAAAAESTESAE